MGAKSEQRKAAILTAVHTVADEAGMSGLSIATVAKAAGVPKSVVLYHFSSRDALLDAALSQWTDKLGARLRLALDPRSRDPRDQLGGWISAFFATEADLRGWKLYLQLSLDAPGTPASARASTFEHEIERGLSGLLARGHKHLAWRAPRPRAMATTLRCLVEGLALACARTGDPSSLKPAQAIARKTALDLLLRS
ncbi:MAG: TetR/AcrR family transcriptional regulator [Myxococcales bacterium]|nr:TetR/AcrR family transcriptional regulator [Myxococcales bacterium]